MKERQTFGRELTPDLLRALDLGEATRRAKREQSRVFWSMIERIFANRHGHDAKRSEGVLSTGVKAC